MTTMTTMTPDLRYLSPAFVARIPRRRYEFTIEEVIAAGAVLTVPEVIAHLDPRKRRFLRSWISPTHSVRLVAVRCGACRRRWRFVCPCGLRSEHLFKRPGDDAATWSCRVCAGLTYSSRRHGLQHPARRVLTPRQAVITKRRDELERRALDSLANSDPWWAQRRDYVLYAMTRAIAERESEAARSAAWLREQIRRPRLTAAVPKDITRSFTPEVLETLRTLNAASAEHVSST
jgi:hypothetical protein